ncbi:MAG: 30S ribosomal protein S20 [Chloroflexi bacterium]|nr:30S ribosomal protein S20 [Chloroflexota bacterium]
MANIQSQIKRHRQNEKRRVRNRNFRGAARTAVTDARLALLENDANTRPAVMKAISALDKAAEKGVLHRNNAARRKSRLMSKLAALSSVGQSADKQVTPPKKASGRKSTGKKTAQKRTATKKAPAKKKA